MSTEWEPCDSCSSRIECTVKGCVKQCPAQPCRSPYCECEVGRCTHPGFFDARGTPQPAAQSEREALTAIMRYAESCKEECGMDPESPQAIRNGKFASIAQMAAQGLGLIRGPSLAQPEQPEPGELTDWPKPALLVDCAQGFVEGWTRSQVELILSTTRKRSDEEMAETDRIRRI